MQVFDDGTRNGEAIIGTGASTNFIQDNQTMPGSMVDDGGGLFHFHHEGAFPRGDIILGTYARKNAIDQAQASAAGRHKTADLGQERDQGYLAQVGRFASHVRASRSYYTLSLLFLLPC